MTPNKFAVLIGVDNYDEPEEGGKGQKKDMDDKPIRYSCLRGAVRDVLRMRYYLIKQVAVNVDNIRMLLSVPYDEEDPIVVAAKNNNVVFGGPNAPTYDNIVCKLKWALKKANSGDLVYIHFSGHGAQATTVFPKLKGNKGYDEALAPMDANRGGKYIRDVEIALLLKKMVCKDLVVTVVLDCCHSGGVTRGGESTGDDGEYTGIRGVHKIYESVDDDWPEDAFVDELIEHGIMKQDGVAHEGNSHADGWLAEVHGYALLAACSPYELAREDRSVTATATVYYGVLTHWLLDSLNRDPGAASSSTRNLYRSIVANLHNSYGHTQSPLMGGSVNRGFFGTRDIKPSHDIRVDKLCTVPLPGVTTELGLDAGALQNVREGSVYGIYPDHAEGGGLGLLLAEAKVDKGAVGATHSSARLTKVIYPVELKVGCRAILRGVFKHYRSRIGFVPTTDDGHIKNLSRVFEKVPKEDSVWMQLVTEPQQGGRGSRAPPLDFLIALKSLEGSGKNEIIEIQDRDGKPIPNVSPPAQLLCPAMETSAWQTLFYRLRHLNLYEKIRRLENEDTTWPTGNPFVFEIVGWNPPWESKQPAAEQNGPFIVNDGDRIHIRVKNNWHRSVYFSVLDLQPLFGVTQAWPRNADAQPLSAHGEVFFHLTVKVPDKLPPDSESCVDTLKAIFTPLSTRFDTLVLKDLPEAEVFTKGGDDDLTECLNPLQRMLDELGSPFKDAKPDEIQEWATKSIVVRTFRCVAS